MGEIPTAIAFANIEGLIIDNSWENLQDLYSTSPIMGVNVGSQLLVTFLNYNVMTAPCFARYAGYPWKTVKVHFPSWTDLVYLKSIKFHAGIKFRDSRIFLKTDFSRV